MRRKFILLALVIICLILIGYIITDKVMIHSDPDKDLMLGDSFYKKSRNDNTAKEKSLEYYSNYLNATIDEKDNIKEITNVLVKFSELSKSLNNPKYINETADFFLQILENGNDYYIDNSNYPWKRELQAFYTNEIIYSLGFDKANKTNLLDEKLFLKIKKIIGKFHPMYPEAIKKIPVLQNYLETSLQNKNELRNILEALETHIYYSRNIEDTDNVIRSADYFIRILEKGLNFYSTVNNYEPTYRLRQFYKLVFADDKTLEKEGNKLLTIEKLLQGLVTDAEAFKGTWKKDVSEKDCWPPNCLKIQFDKLDPNFIVESNQICVSAFYKIEPSTRTVQLFFKEPTDLGVGGASLPWKNFDNSKPLAIITFTNPERTQISIKWFGFINKTQPNTKLSFGNGYEGLFNKVQ